MFPHQKSKIDETGDFEISIFGPWEGHWTVVNKTKTDEMDSLVLEVASSFGCRQLTTKHEMFQVPATEKNEADKERTEESK